MSAVILPLLILAGLGWLIPWGIGRLVPEGVPWLVINGLLSTVLLTCAAIAVFVVLYGDAGGVVWWDAPGHFLILAARSAIVWAPAMVLSLANLPRRWKTVTW